MDIELKLGLDDVIEAIKESLKKKGIDIGKDPEIGVIGEGDDICFILSIAGDNIGTITAKPKRAVRRKPPAKTAPAKEEGDEKTEQTESTGSGILKNAVADKDGDINEEEEGSVSEVESEEPAATKSIFS